MLIVISTFMKDFWWLILLSLAAAYVAFRLFVSTEKGRYAYDRYILKVPLVGSLYRKHLLSRFASTLSTLLASGLPAMESLRIVGAVMNNRYLAEVIENIRTKIMEGADIATPLKQSGVFPPVLSYMVAVGEESGSLEDLLQRVAEATEEEIEVSTQRFTALLEPLMILVMAVMVAFIIVSILLPLLEMASIGR
jgi:general secretion pathway protein F